MSDALNIYLSIQALLSLSFFMLWFLKNKGPKLDYTSLLRLSYTLIFASMLVPIVYSVLPGENPFGPIFKVWTEAGTEVTETLPQSLVNFQLPATAISPALGWSVPFNWGLGLFALVFGFVLWSMYGLLKCFYELNRVVGNSFLMKSYGQVRVWLNDGVEVPFSYFNGSAHVVLPSDIIADPSKLKIAVAHELQHHRQKDTLWVYFLEIIKVLFAVNPLVGKLIGQTMETQELACDEALVGRKSFSPHLYGKCLHDFAEKQLLKLHSPVGAVGMAVEAKFLKRRIEAMFQHKEYTSKKAFTTLLFLGLLTITCAGWTFRGAVTDQQITMAQAQKMAESISAKQEIPIVVDSAVLYWLNKAVGSEKSRKYLREALVRMKNYEAMIQGKLGQASLPEELIAVPLVESGFKNNVKSTMKAVGIWQFIPQTARRCGLEVSDEQDERLNPTRLTEAAVCYYEKLHAIFQNWHVAVSAYNIGERRMMGAIAEAGHNDVFKLAREGYLGNEGKNYLPKIIAGMIIVNNPELVD